MKSRFAIFTALTLFVLLFSSCDEKKVFCIKGKGATETYTLELPAIHGFDLQIPADVTLSQGPQSITVTTQSNIMENIKLNVVDGIWEIEYKDCVKGNEALPIDITLPDLTLAQISGSGSVTGLTPFNELNDLSLKIHGSGNMTLEANCATLETQITGSGDLDLAVTSSTMESNISGSGDLRYTGSTDDHTVNISGSGNLQAFEFPTNQTTITVSGSGSCRVFANNDLDVTISGSGDVYYKGQPGINVNISGSGRLINAN